MSNNHYQAKGGQNWNASGAEDLRKHQSYDGGAGPKAHNPFNAGKSGGGGGGGGGPPVFFRSKTTSMPSAQDERETEAPPQQR